MMSDTLLARLTMDNEPITHLYPGWRAISRHSLPDLIDVVLLRESNTGREACWWVTPDGHYLASNTFALSSDVQNKIIESLIHNLHPLMHHSLIHTPQNALPIDDPVLNILATFPLTALTEIIGLWCNHIAPGIIMISSQDFFDGDTSADNNEEHNESPFSSKRIREIMACRYHDDDHPPVVISPFSTLPLKPQLIMKSHCSVTCRFYDPIESLTFYLSWQFPDKNKIQADIEPIFYYPQGPLIIGDGPEANLLPTRLMVWLIQNPTHPKTIHHSPSFQLEDYGLGQISDIWKTLSPSSGDTTSLSSLSSEDHSTVLENTVSISPILQNYSLDNEVSGFSSTYFSSKNEKKKHT